MSRESTLVSGRARAEEAFTDTIAWYEYTGTPTQNETTGAVTTPEVFVFRTKCKVRIGAIGTLVPTAREQREVGGEVTTLRSVVHLPQSAPALKPNMIGHIEAVGEFSDLQLLDKRLRVVSPVGQSYATARRFSVEEVL